MIGHTGSFLTPDLVSTHDIKLLLTMMVPAFEQSKNKQDNVFTHQRSKQGNDPMLHEKVRAEFAHQN